MYNFISIGHDCSPAAAQRGLNYRNFALPFDWIVTNIKGLNKCFEEDFSRFHTNLKYNHDKSRLIDDYDFEYPHDYPFENTTDLNNVGKGVYGENKETSIVDNWHDYYEVIKEKYNRRIVRFRNIMHDTKPIIVLCRYHINDLIALYRLLINYYNKDNIYIINSSQVVSFNIISTNIISINTEINDIWNEGAIWKKYIDYIIEIIEIKM